MAVQWIALCVAAALICALVRTQRPELATAISLAAGVAVVAALLQDFRQALPQAEALMNAFSNMDPDVLSAVLRGAGISIIADLGAQLCRDAGETALAGRVALVARLSILALCVPLLSQLAQLLSRLAS